MISWFLAFSLFDLIFNPSLILTCPHSFEEPASLPGFFSRVRGRRTGRVGAFQRKRLQLALVVRVRLRTVVDRGAGAERPTAALADHGRLDVARSESHVRQPRTSACHRAQDPTSAPHFCSDTRYSVSHVQSHPTHTHLHAVNRCMSFHAFIFQR